MRAQVASLEVFGDTQLPQAADCAILAVFDDGDDVVILALAAELHIFVRVFAASAILVFRHIGVTDFLKVEGHLVFAEVAGERDAIAVGYFAADSGLPNGDGAVAGHEVEKFVAAHDLKIIEARQQGTEANQHKSC